jgi:hypothetical protein
VICNNAVTGAGYAQLGATSSLPNPPPPAFVRPIDIVSIAAIDPHTYGNTFDASPYHPHLAIGAPAVHASGRHRRPHAAPAVTHRR